mmetsp:Transcript_24865/g.55229  ORF Transcript_24865/g.55229 Transcript_24865/m.55229 type:complete len:323 (-) Transcript_24865:292-1260(-)
MRSLERMEKPSTSARPEKLQLLSIPRKRSCSASWATTTFTNCSDDSTLDQSEWTKDDLSQGGLSPYPSEMREEALSPRDSNSNSGVYQLQEARNPAAVPKVGWWWLVWCHGHCYKQACDAEREFLAQYAWASGGVLVCFKKANKFEMWRRRAVRTPYILLTDWREGKLSMEYLKESGSNLPALMLLTYEAPREFTRISTWAGNQQGPCEIRLCHAKALETMFAPHLLQYLKEYDEAKPVAVHAPPKSAERDTTLSEKQIGNDRSQMVQRVQSSSAVTSEKQRLFQQRLMHLSKMLFRKAVLPSNTVELEHLLQVALPDFYLD